jgi:calcium-binding protein CML
VAPQDEAAAEEVAHKLRKMLGKVGNLRTAFKHFERNAEGNISRKALHKGMKSLGFDGLTDSELVVLLDVMDKDGDGEVSFEDFVDFASANPAEKKRSAPHDDSGASDEEGSTSNAVTVQIHKLKLAKQSSSLTRIYLQYKLPDQDFKRTQAIPIQDPRKKQTLDIDHDGSIRIASGSQARKSLRAALRANKCKLQVELLGVNATGRTKVLGQAAIDLQDILEDLRDLQQSQIALMDDDDHLVAKATVSVEALDLLQTLQRG